MVSAKPKKEPQKQKLQLKKVQAKVCGDLLLVPSQVLVEQSFLGGNPLVGMAAAQGGKALGNAFG